MRAIHHFIDPCIVIKHFICFTKEEIPLDASLSLRHFLKWKGRVFRNSAQILYILIECWSRMLGNIKKGKRILLIFLMSSSDMSCNKSQNLIKLNLIVGWIFTPSENLSVLRSINNWLIFLPITGKCMQFFRVIVPIFTV